MYTLKRPSDIKNIDLQTEENCFVAVMKSNGEYIKYVLEPSDNLIKLALRIDGANIRFIPFEKQTREVCKLAAIHGAPLNLLPETDEEIDKIVEISDRIIEKKSEDKRSKIYNNFKINDEPINPGKTFTLALIKDNPEYLQYYVNQGLRIPCYDDNNILVNSKGDAYYFGSFRIVEDLISTIKPEASLIYSTEGKFNRALAKNCIEADPSVIYTLNTEDIDMELVRTAIRFGGMKVIEAMNLAPHIACKIALEAGHGYNSGSQKREDQIKDVYTYFNGELPLAELEEADDNNDNYSVKVLLCETPAELIKSQEQADMMLKKVFEYSKKTDSSYLSFYVRDFVKETYPKVAKLSAKVVKEISEYYPSIFEFITEEVEEELIEEDSLEPVFFYLETFDDDDHDDVYTPNISLYDNTEIQDKIYKVFGQVADSVKGYTRRYRIEYVNKFRRTYKNALDTLGFDSSQIPEENY